MSTDFFAEELPPPSASLGLGAAGICEAFPFHLGVDGDLRVVQCGATIARLIPQLHERPLLSDIFEARGQPLPRSFAAFGTISHRLLRLGCRHREALVLRGQFLPDASLTHLLFIGSPEVNDLARIVELELSINDFAAQDMVNDYLILLQTQQAALADANHMAEALELLNHDLEERVAARTKSLEEANIALREQMAERARIEQELRLAQKLESVGQLAAGIAHEINTPIQFIGDNLRFVAESLGQLEQVYTAMEALRTAAAERPEAVELSRAMEAADLDYARSEMPNAVAQGLEGVDRVATLVRALKEFSHPDVAESVPTDLNQAIRTTLTVARNEYKYVAELVTDLAAELPPTPCHVSEFNQVVLNLVVNAAHAIADVQAQRGRGTITVTTRRAGPWCEVLIGDTGTGIPEAIRERIFDPFFTTKPVGRGTGQGLYLARSIIVDRHKGELSFTSTVGQGTTFLIRLPLTPAGKEAA